MDAPGAVVTLETEDGETHVLTIGAQNTEDTTYAAKSSDSPYYVSIAEYLVKAMVENKREDFLDLPVTPTPEATPAP